MHAGFNGLTSLPGELGLCRELKTLDVRNNKLQVRVRGLQAQQQPVVQAFQVKKHGE